MAGVSKGAAGEVLAARFLREKGYALVPLQLYFKDALVKVEIALCKGKHTYDKKQALAERDRKRDMQRAIKEYS